MCCRRSPRGGVGADTLNGMSVDLPMSEQTRDWTRRPWSPAQLAYAALDADVLLPLAEVLGV